MFNRADGRVVFLVDTNVISEARKASRADPGVRAFFAEAVGRQQPLYLSCVTVGELRRGVELIRRRGDARQVRVLEAWLDNVLEHYAHSILPFDATSAQVWGHLRVPDPERALDKQVAAIALVHDLIVVTRNVADFERTGVRVMNPFAGAC